MTTLSIRCVRTVAALLASAVCTASLAQTAIYSNASADPTNPGLSTGTLTGTGISAPAGSAWSEVQDVFAGESNALGGATASPGSAGGAYRLADDVHIAGSFGWRLHALSFYVYEPAGSSSTPPIASATLRIWNAAPGSPGAIVLFGDTTTNRLAATSFANLYRVFNTDGPSLAATPDTTRPIWRADVAFGDLTLLPGTYWFDWQLTPANPGNPLFAPAITRAGSRGDAGWNALQLAPGGAWSPVLDPGKPAAAADLPQDLPFIVTGDVLTTPCGADYNGDGFVTGDDFDLFVQAFQLGSFGGDFTQDGFVTGDDFDAFVAAFNAGDPTADANHDGFITGDDFDSFVDDFNAGRHGADFNQDGFITGDDFDAFVNAFEAGC